MTRACLAVFLVCGAASIAAAQSGERYTLRGQVVDGVTGRPLPGLQISIRKDPEWEPAKDPVVSGPDGRFVFFGLEAGRYAADTWLNGETIHYLELPAGTVGAMDVGADFKNAEFNFPVTRHPSVEGIVRDEFGDPVPLADVKAFRATWADGRIMQTDLLLQTVTHDRGHYRLSALAPGAWSVCANFMNATGNEWYRATAPATSSIIDFASKESPRFYKSSCYPGDPSVSLKADWGQDLNADLKLVSTTAIKVRGRVSNWQPGMFLDLGAEDERVPRPPPSIRPDGTFEFSVLEPGQYVLYSETLDKDGPAEVAQQAVAIEKDDISGVQLTMQRAAHISVVVQGPATPAVEPASVSIALREVSSHWANTYFARHAPDGSFKFQGLGPGAYWVVARTQAPFCIQSITFGGRRVLHDRVTLSSGDTGAMEVVLSTQCARIDGKVLIQEGSGPYPFVTMMMSGTAQAPGDLFNILLGEDGSFSVGLLPPGRYYLWAWSQNDPGFPGPASLAEVADQSTVVEVGRGQRAITQVRLLSSHKEGK